MHVIQPKKAMKPEGPLFPKGIACDPLGRPLQVSTSQTPWTTIRIVLACSVLSLICFFAGCMCGLFFQQTILDSSLLKKEGMIANLRHDLVQKSRKTFEKGLAHLSGETSPEAPEVSTQKDQMHQTQMSQTEAKQATGSGIKQPLFTLSLGTFETAEKAERFQGHLRAMSLAIDIVSVQTGWSVRVGKYALFSEAEAYAKILLYHYGLSAVVTPIV